MGDLNLNIELSVTWPCHLQMFFYSFLNYGVRCPDGGSYPKMANDLNADDTVRCDKNIIYFNIYTRHEVHRAQAHTVCTTQVKTDTERSVTALEAEHSCSLTRNTLYRNNITDTFLR